MSFNNNASNVISLLICTTILKTILHTFAIFRIYIFIMYVCMFTIKYLYEKIKDKTFVKFIFF